MRINDKETKFNVGDVVYYVESVDNSVVSSIISIIIISDNPEIHYEMKDGSVRKEKQLYVTKEEAEEERKKRKIKVYLSGAIANDKDYVSKFMTAKSEVSDRGYSVLSPIETEESLQEKGVKECMFASIELLRQADVMLLLDNPDTIESRGMQIEKTMASYCDIPVVSDYIELDMFYNCKFGENKKENKPYEEQEE